MYFDKDVDINITINVENEYKKYFTLNCDLTLLTKALYI